MAGPATDKRWPARWVLGSLLVHAALGFTALGPRHPPASNAAAPAPSPPVEVEVVVDAAPLAPPAGLAPELASPPQGRARTGAAAQASAAPAPTETDADAEPGGAVGEPAEETLSPPAASASAPHLSLAALGVDGQNPFLDRGDPAAAQAAKVARVKRRLDRALAQGLVNSDVALGRGAGGPVLRAFEAATYASTAPLNGRASFVLVIDGDGKLVSSLLGSASGDREAWARVARQTAQALAQHKLRVPRGRSVQLAVEVSSHLEMPSGADPGVELSVQGVPLKKGGGPRSTKLDLSIFPFPAATLAGDPSDIGARPRRMVHAHVVSEELL